MLATHSAGHFKLLQLETPLVWSVIFLCVRVGLSTELIGLLLCLAAAVFTLVGGVGGGLYMAYFMCAGVLGLLLYYFIGAFYPTDQNTKHSWGFMYEDRPVVDTVCGIVQCARTLNTSTNLDGSVLTFSSNKAYIAGACSLLSMLFILSFWNFHEVYELFFKYIRFCFLTILTDFLSSVERAAKKSRNLTKTICSFLSNHRNFIRKFFYTIRYTIVIQLQVVMKYFSTRQIFSDTLTWPLSLLTQKS